MLEHQMKVLSSLSDNKELFLKELNKSMHWLNLTDKEQLLEWIKQNYSSLYPNLKDHHQN